MTLSANLTNGTVYNITTTNFGGIPAGDGVFAGAFGAGNQTAEVLSNAPGFVTVINGGFGVSGIAALTTGAGAGGQAEILMSRRARRHDHGQRSSPSTTASRRSTSPAPPT